MKGRDQQPGLPLLAFYFLVYQGLLYHHTVHQVQPTKLLIVPCLTVDLAMHLIHSHPLGSHLVVQNTLEKIQDQFWLQMNAELKNFCHHCP